MTLVERLRSFSSWMISFAFGKIPDEAAMCLEAADRIESLEAELEKAREAALEEAAKVAEEPRRYFVSGPDVRQYVVFSATEAATAIRSLSHKEG